MALKHSHLPMAVTWCVWAGKPSTKPPALTLSHLPTCLVALVVLVAGTPHARSMAAHSPTAPARPACCCGGLLPDSAACFFLHLYF